MNHEADSTHQVWADALDPSRDDPEYWDRFHAQVMARCELPLARRRAAHRISVAATLTAWRNAVVPAALAAAAVAALLLWQPVDAAHGEERVVELGEWLLQGIEDEREMGFHAPLETTGAAVGFAAEIF